MFKGHYDEWREARMKGINKYIDNSFFEGKSLLEVGAGFADLGNMFSEKGCTVTSSDGRGQHLSVIQERYPHLKLMFYDCDIDKLEENYDIILHWGTLYHVNNIETNLEDVANHCCYLFLETEISDTNDIFCLKVNEEPYHLDQAAHAIGSRPSPSYVESLLNKNNFNYKMILDDIINSTCHKYNEPILETKTSRNGFRRYWICWKKDVPCPIRHEFQ